MRPATIFICLLLAGCGSQKAKEDARRELEMGRLAFERGANDEALQHYDAAIAILPSEDAFIEKAWLYRDQQKWKLARGISRDGLKKYPKSVKLNEIATQAEGILEQLEAEQEREKLIRNAERKRAEIEFAKERLRLWLDEHESQQLTSPDARRDLANRLSPAEKDSLKRQLYQLLADVPYWIDKKERVLGQEHVENSVRWGAIDLEVAVRREFANQPSDVDQREKLIAVEIDERVQRRLVKLDQNK